MKLQLTINGAEDEIEVLAPVPACRFRWGGAERSASVAAAEPPARPEPTTMIVCFRLLAGFTSLRLKRCRSQRVSIGPPGALESRAILLE